MSFFTSRDEFGSQWNSPPAGGPNNLFGLRGLWLFADLTGYTEAQLAVFVGGSAYFAARLGVQYTTDGFISGTTNSTPTWHWFDADTKAPHSTQLIGDNDGNWNVSGWAAIPLAARAPVWLRVVLFDNGGTDAPRFNNVYLAVR